MLKTVSAAVLAGALSTAAVADEPQYGVGVGVAGQDSALIKGSVSLENNLRLEPFLGFTYHDGDTTSTTNFQIGTALEVMKPISSAINAYYGGYAGIVTNSTDYTINNTTTSVSSTNLNLGPVAGVEYAFDKQFTLGAEVRFDIGFGDVTTFGTNSSVLLRYYF